MRPLIGMTPTPELLEMEHGTFRRHTLSDHYSRAVIAAGGTPVMLPSNIADIDSLLDRLDAVVITGGGDIDPAQYGQETYEKTAGIDAERDAFEIALFHATIARDMPLLGICRGLQVVNVASGGTLHQDIGDHFPEAVEHRQQSLKIHHEEPFQQATLTAGENTLREILPHDTVEINSFHHQGIDELAPTLRAIATTADGLIEAVQVPAATFGLAVQWHPELLAHRSAENAAIFAALVEAATTYHQRLTGTLPVEAL